MAEEKEFEESGGMGPGEETVDGPGGTGGPATHVKADVLNRSIARFIDILIALLLGRLPDYIGVFAALTYIGIADGLPGGKSIGKRIIGLTVRNIRTGGPADFRASILRNSTIGIAYILSLIPLIGWALALAALALELLLAIGSPEGRRLGDETALTFVVDDTV